MAYSPTSWVDGTTPIDATNLNKIEQAISSNASVLDDIVYPMCYKGQLTTKNNLDDVFGETGYYDFLINNLPDGMPSNSSNGGSMVLLFYLGVVKTTVQILIQPGGVVAGISKIFSRRYSASNGGWSDWGQWNLTFT